MKFLRTILTRSDDGADHPEDPGYLDADHCETGSEVEDWDEEVNEEDYAAVMGRPVAVADPDMGSDPVEDTENGTRFEDEPGTGEEDQEVPIWELFEEEAAANSDPGEPDVTATDDANIKDLARNALEKLEGRVKPEVELATGGRVKTRLLGFSRGDDVQSDVFAKGQSAPSQAQQDFPVGWLVVIEGPGRGAQFTLRDCVAKIGRGADQGISLNFGDQAISRDNHAAIAYDNEQNEFFLGHSGKANLVRLNGKPVLATEEISNGDLIRIGETTLRFTAFCSAEFAWDLVGQDEADCA